MIHAQQHVLATAIILAIFVVFAIHIFLFPVYTANSPSRRIKLSSYEQLALCHTTHLHSNINAKTKKGVPCPEYGIVSGTQGGRLGNQIWEYSSVWAVARRTGLESYMPKCILKTLLEYFENLSIPSLSLISKCTIDVSQTVSSLKEWNDTSQNIILPMYATYWSLISPWVDDIRQEFKFKKNLRQYAQQVFRKGLEQYNITEAVFVSVHVRRTDYVDYLWQKLKMRPAPVHYYTRAMRYFENKYNNVIFIVASDNIKWCKYHLQYKGRKLKFISSSDTREPGKDLAVLSFCNHSIIDYGTYGSFGAMMAAGETIVYNVTGLISTTIAQTLPNWIIMS